MGCLEIYSIVINSYEYGYLETKNKHSCTQTITVLYIEICINLTGLCV